MEKLHESFEEDLITKQVYMERKAVRSRQVQKLEEEIRELRNTITDEEGAPIIEEEKNERIDRFIELWSAAATDEEKNRALKQLIDKNNL